MNNCVAKWLGILAAVLGILLQVYWYEIRKTDDRTDWMLEVPHAAR